MRRDQGAGIGGARIQPDAEPGCAAVHIEAALIGSGRAPGLLRHNFCLKHVIGFDANLWKEVRLEVRATSRQVKAPIVATDRDPRMIDAARNLTDANSRSCEWRTADVTKLPFEAGTFSVALCQQGLQFFPDRELALREIERVLQPGGRIALTVWSEASALFGESS